MITLRALEPEDLELLYLVENDPELWPFGSANSPYSHYALRQYLEQCTSDVYTDRQLRLVVEADGQAVGFVDLLDFSPEHLRAEVGVMILKQYRRRGYCRQALASLEQYAREVVHLHLLYALIAASNAPCLSAFSAAGYNQQARLKDWLWRGETYEDVVAVQKILKNIP